MTDDLHSFGDFWPFYLREHSRPLTRHLHVLGTGLGLVLLIAGLAAEPWLMLTAPLAGYGCAWLAHLAIEHNRPATFRHPWWSFLADLRLFLLAVTGRLGVELQRHGLG